MPLNVLGWGSILVSSALSAWAHGAWGVAVQSLFAMAAALLLLVPSIASAPTWKRKPVDRGVHASPDTKGSMALGRRAATFVITGPVALFGALLLALALRAMLAAGGGSEADANVLVLACVPIFWGILATILLMMERRRTQLSVLATLTIIAVPLTLLAG
ncbi:hypothetical protein [Aurantiacibacter poecillastricola]|uniref:hypothetical protein n=1 Tax=Aurantiacibacter poecillastricola TaxID=3064385 RepID=UPI00273F7A80|nr:hypothetical protein [Aurantiacibacter sp. 219JJ12-13]MDP5261553.1 hypothetical protein [Aurantiacibacter sp. 219JJ12-13]